MDQTFTTMLLMLIFFGVFSGGIGYSFYMVWFQFAQLQAALIERNQKQIKSRWSFAYLANSWLRHWSYKWFARAVTLLLLPFGCMGMIVSLYGLLSL